MRISHCEVSQEFISTGLACSIPDILSCYWWRKQQRNKAFGESNRHSCEDKVGTEERKPRGMLMLETGESRAEGLGL